VAGAFTLLTWMTGQPHWDALGSIAVGLLMGIIAIQLMRTNKRFLIGEAHDLPARPAACLMLAPVAAAVTSTPRHVGSALMRMLL
jgi:multisubunit Na+/H+ antiporter MnhE subunit